ncbi:MAG TPA: serine/threonine-protein kinase [Kofleriaceae bacterium]
MLEPGSIVGGKFRIERILGEGGMGVVAVATHLQLDRLVAFKVLHDQAAADRGTVERFLREARAVAKLRSEHICQVTDFGQLDSGAPYLVMELLDGADLSHVIAAQPLAPPIAVDYVVQACVAVAEAHACGIVHRDLKPANLFLTRRLDGSALVKVLDFGIAKAPVGADASLTRTDVVMGTPGYMAPEQLRSARDVDTRADIWALGVILYQALSGRLPFPAGSLTEIAVKIAMDAPDPIDLPPGLRAIVMRCLEKDRDRRFRDVGELVYALAPFGPPSVAANASMIARLSIASGNSATVAAQTTPFAVPTTLQGASASMQPTMPVQGGRSTGLWIGGVIVACAAIAGVAVLAQHKDAAQPAPAPIAATAADAGIAVANIDAQELALVAPEPPPEDPRLQVPSLPAVTPNQPSQPKPVTRPTTNSGAKREFADAIATHHCIRAARLIAQLPGDPDASKQVSQCTTDRVKAMQDPSGPDAEAWANAEFDELAELGNADAAHKARDGFYLGRSVALCRKHDASARASYAKIVDTKFRDIVVRSCKVYGTPVD